MLRPSDNNYQLLYSSERKKKHSAPELDLSQSNNVDERTIKTEVQTMTNSGSVDDCLPPGTSGKQQQH